MSTLPTAYDYTDLDFSSLRSRLRKLITSVFPTWTDESVAGFGNLLVELFAHVGDVSTYYLDLRTRERFIASATERKSLLGLAKLLGYAPRARTAATADVTLTLASALAGTLTIPAGTTVRTLDPRAPVVYQLLSDAVFLPAELTRTVAAEHSTTRSESFTATGLANQEVTVSATPYIHQSAQVADASGTWTEVANFLDSTSSSRDFVTIVDKDDRLTVRFGDGVLGAVPSGTIQVVYKTGGGIAGRVEVDKLRRIDGTFLDNLGAAAILSVTNAPSSGGEDRESNEQIRVNAPASLRVLGRAVAREDYEVAALTVSGVVRALHLTKDQGLGVGENEGVLFIVPDGGGAPSALLLAQVTALFATGGAYPKTNTYRLTVSGASYHVVNVSTVVFPRAGVSNATLKANVEAALAAFFSPTTTDTSGAQVRNDAIDFGYGYLDEETGASVPLPYSDVYNAVRDATGVRKIDDGSGGLLLNGVAKDVSIGIHEFPSLGSVTIVNGITGETL